MIRAHEEQVPQPIAGSIAQLSEAAIASAAERLPDPLGPRSSHA
jgi:hypothetical protein